MPTDPWHPVRCNRLPTAAPSHRPVDGPRPHPPLGWLSSWGPSSLASSGHLAEGKPWSWEGPKVTPTRPPTHSGQAREQATVWTYCPGLYHPRGHRLLPGARGQGTSREEKGRPLPSPWLLFPPLTLQFPAVEAG